MDKDITKGWSWGAFSLSWIWGIRCRVWSTLYVFIPGFGLVWSFILGARGREWAWKKGNWRNKEHFQKVQNRWDIAGVIAIAVAILLQVLPSLL